MVYQITSCFLTSSLILMCILAVFGVLAQCGYSWLCLSAASCFPPDMLPTLWWCPGPGRPRDLPILCESWDCGSFPSLLGAHQSQPESDGEPQHWPQRELGGVMTWARTAVIKIPLSCHQLLLWLTAFDTPAAQPPSLIWTAMPYSWVPSDNCSLGD